MILEVAGSNPVVHPRKFFRQGGKMDNPYEYWLARDAAVAANAAAVAGPLLSNFEVAVVVGAAFVLMVFPVFAAFVN